ncbi:J domain-containing protein [Parasphingorhabdus halotolerans]|uniref:J domain-containing protein n=1 Tax=Parasphingorhabdus halotolerans TaxID=2725558 RepID=A0A6H2DHK6_9SPHN|nr:J domain-containing protein [Parasphingorhabdus halotolerans]QJB68152.1 J domain-containing protein [Parasphingorhabdus halotolerans]
MSASPKKRPNHLHGRVETNGQPCAVEGCEEDGEFRAPSLYGARHGYDGPGEYRWLCLDHVRAFNQSYDFFAGMNSEEIFEAQHPVRGWDSARRIYNGDPSVTPAWADFTDPLDAIGARFAAGINRRQNAEPQISGADQKALKTLGLGDTAARNDIRHAYSTLVRKYHPDRNGGDRSHEKQLANVIAAYTHLKTSTLFES